MKTESQGDRADVLRALSLLAEDPVSILDVVRGARTRSDAATALQRDYQLSELAAYSLLDCQVGRLTASGRRQIEEELASLAADGGTVGT